ncbi:MAG: phosphoglycerate kinase [Paracoccaceae bacterium]|nr:phosphoglycerate kinase [Paracoccaceae bacterium]
MGWKTLDDMDLDGKTVVTRVDINVPVENGVVTDATRIERIKPTIDDILAKGGKPVLLAHFGRPKGQPNPEMSLRIVQPKLEEVLGRAVTFVERPSREMIDAAPANAVILVENTRFTKMETDNDPQMAKFLASLGDVYVNDAFSAAHRAHASTEGVARLLPSAAGRLMEAELSALEKALGSPERPVVALVGGAKVSTKLELLANLVRRVDHLVIGGGMANTFLAAQGHEIGTSLAEREMTGTAADILAGADEAACEIILPVDVAVADKLEERKSVTHAAIGDVAADQAIFDAGPLTVTRIKEVLGAAKTFVMNGPLGVFEVAPYHQATFGVLDEVARLTNAGKLVSIAGGGDTVGAINAAGHYDDFSYVSTAGGAFLEWMEGKELPGVAALMQQD